MDLVFVSAFTAAVIGGLDSPAGAVVGGLGLGLVLSYASGYLGSDVTSIAVLVLLVLVLLVRPNGVFSSPRSGGCEHADSVWQSTLLRHLVVALVAVIVAIMFATGYVETFYDYQLAVIAAYLCAVAGLTVLTGQNGQVSLGQSALMAVGAYTTALLQQMFSDHDVTTQWTLLYSLVGGGRHQRGRRSGHRTRRGPAARALPGRSHAGDRAGGAGHHHALVRSLRRRPGSAGADEPAAGDARRRLPERAVAGLLRHDRRGGDACSCSPT